MKILSIFKLHSLFVLVGVSILQSTISYASEATSTTPSFVCSISNTAHLYEGEKKEPFYCRVGKACPRAGAERIGGFIAKTAIPALRNKFRKHLGMGKLKVESPRLYLPFSEEASVIQVPGEAFAISFFNPKERRGAGIRWGIRAGRAALLIASTAAPLGALVSGSKVAATTVLTAGTAALSATQNGDVAKLAGATLQAGSVLGALKKGVSDRARDAKALCATRFLCFGKVSFSIDDDPEIEGGILIVPEFDQASALAFYDTGKKGSFEKFTLQLEALKQAQIEDESASAAPAQTTTEENK